MSQPFWVDVSYFSLQSCFYNLLYVSSFEFFILKDDSREAFSLLAQIIFNMNEMQDEKFTSYPVASFVAHLRGKLYNQIMDVHNGFVTSIVLSGSGNTGNTGKSLMTAIWQIVFDGQKSKEQGISITQSALFAKLDKGVPYYGTVIFFWNASSKICH